MSPARAADTRPTRSGTPFCLIFGLLVGFIDALAENSAQASPYEGRNPYSYGSAEYRNFSESQRRNSGTLESYRELSTRFNREISGRYPFGPMATGDVDTRTVCDYFRINEARIESIRIALDSMQSYPSQVEFLKELASAGKFLANTACSRFNQPVRMIFRPKDDAPITSNPPRTWLLTDDFGEARYPHGIPHLDWRFGSPIALEVTWAEYTGLRPRQPNARDEFETPDSATVRFGKDGDWALMRFIDAYGQKYRSFPDDTAALDLSFSVPLIQKLEASRPASSTGSNGDAFRQPPHEAHTSLTIQIKFEHYEAGKPRRYLKWPGPFPTSAPW